MELPDVIKEQSCCALGRYDGVGSHEMRLLCREVNDIHDCIVAVGTQEFADEVNTYDVPRRVRDGHRVQFAVRFVPRRLRATAQIASLRVQTDFPAKAGDDLKVVSKG